MPPALPGEDVTAMYGVLGDSDNRRAAMWSILDDLGR